MTDNKRQKNSQSYKLLVSSLKPRRGLTLIELLIGMVIFAILGGMGLFLSMDQYRTYVLSSDRNMAVALIQKARNHAMNNINESPHGFSVQGSNFVVFQGATYAARNTAYDEIIARSGAVTISGAQEFIFNQLRGDLSTAPGDMVLTSAANSYTVSLNSEGRVNW